VAFVGALAAFAGWRFSSSLQGTDFPDFYCAARMLAEGHGHQLYDVEVQRQYQARYSGRVGTLYIHPPFEAVFYLTVAWLPLRNAYLLWFFLSLTFLAVAARRLARDALLPWDWRLLLAASLTFVPVLLCLAQGQDSLLLLLVVVFAFTAFRRDRDFAAGCWLGLGLFKFQIVLPLAFVLVVARSGSARREFAKGLALVALAFAGLSAAIAGGSVFTVYPKFLVHLQAQSYAGIFPQAMANFRGLIFFFFPRDPSGWALAGVCLLSAASLIKTLIDWKRARGTSPARLVTPSRDDVDVAFANTIIFALLVSYHLNPHDLSLLLLAIAVLLHCTLAQKSKRHSGQWIASGLLTILAMPPLQVWALKADAYALIAIPLALLFLTTGFIHENQREN
jgi:hypothetical protein